MLSWKLWSPTFTRMGHPQTSAVSLAHRGQVRTMWRRPSAGERGWGQGPLLPPNPTQQMASDQGGRGKMPWSTLTAHRKRHPEQDASVMTQTHEQVQADQAGRPMGGVREGHRQPTAGPRPAGCSATGPDPGRAPPGQADLTLEASPSTARAGGNPTGSTPGGQLVSVRGDPPQGTQAPLPGQAAPVSPPQSSPHPATRLATLCWNLPLLPTSR